MHEAPPATAGRASSERAMGFEPTTLSLEGHARASGGHQAVRIYNGLRNSAPGGVRSRQGVFDTVPDTVLAARMSRNRVAVSRRAARRGIPAARCGAGCRRHARTPSPRVTSRRGRARATSSRLTGIHCARDFPSAPALSTRVAVCRRAAQQVCLNIFDRISPACQLTRAKNRQADCINDRDYDQEQGG
jgi:hypothetical protein